MNAADPVLTGLPLPTAGDLLRIPVRKITPATPVSQALGKMGAYRMTHVPVMEAGHCVGLVSATQILVAASGGEAGLERAVGELCRRPVPSVQRGDPFQAVVELMVDAHTDAVVVLDGVTVLGIVTAVELVAVVADRWRYGAAPLIPMRPPAQSRGSGPRGTGPATSGTR